MNILLPLLAIVFAIMFLIGFIGLLLRGFEVVSAQQRFRKYMFEHYPDEAERLRDHIPTSSAFRGFNTGRFLYKKEYLALNDPRLTELGDAVCKAVHVSHRNVLVGVVTGVAILVGLALLLN